MIIKNKPELATDTHRSLALTLIESGIQAVLPDRCLTRHVTFHGENRELTVAGNKFSFRDGRLFVVGFGKASGKMAQVFERIVEPKYITAGLVNCTDANYHTKKIVINVAGHPLPDQNGVAGTSEILSLKDTYRIDEKDLLVCLVSGGGSALFESPQPPVTLKDIQDLTKIMLASGATINEINVIRKHISLVKGGKLGRHFAPATIVSLIISDVMGNDLSTIASGPTTVDHSTYDQALNLLQKYSATNVIPPTVLTVLKDGQRGKFAETAKKLTNCHNFIVGDNLQALEAVRDEAITRGLIPKIILMPLSGDTTAQARKIADEIKSGVYKNCDILIAGGETTPTLPKDHGMGGRNQHFAAVTLAALSHLPRHWVHVSVGSDGTDYLKEVAGAIIDGQTAAYTTSVELKDFLTRFDTFHLFKKIGASLIRTGNTGTNVCDIALYLFK